MSWNFFFQEISIRYSEETSFDEIFEKDTNKLMLKEFRHYSGMF